MPLSNRLRQRAHQQHTWLCVGLDPVLDRLPAGVPRTVDGVVQFCEQIVQVTVDHVVAFKINFAFFEALGPDGWQALQRVRASIPDHIPAVADAKRGDIGNTSRAYAQAIFDVLGFDAVTVSPFLGWDSVAPFAGYADKGVLILCKTSNADAGDLQDLTVDGIPLYLRVAQEVLRWPARADMGLVVGATQPEALQRVRDLSGETILLVPGVGAQGASAVQAVKLGANAQGDNALIAVSRQILYASGEAAYPQAAGEAAEELAAATWQKAADHADH